MLECSTSLTLPQVTKQIIAVVVSLYHRLYPLRSTHIVTGFPPCDTSVVPSPCSGPQGEVWDMIAIRDLMFFVGTFTQLQLYNPTSNPPTGNIASFNFTSQTWTPMCSRKFTFSLFYNSSVIFSDCFQRTDAKQTSHLSLWWWWWTSDFIGGYGPLHLDR